MCIREEFELVCGGLLIRLLDACELNRKLFISSTGDSPSDGELGGEGVRSAVVCWMEFAEGLTGETNDVLLERSRESIDDGRRLGDGIAGTIAIGLVKVMELCLELAGESCGVSMIPIMLDATISAKLELTDSLRPSRCSGTAKEEFSFSGVMFASVSVLFVS